MFSTQREVRFAVIKFVFLPRFGVVAILAFLAVLAFVVIVMFVAAVAVGWQFQLLVFVLSQFLRCVTAIARSFFVLPM